MSRVTYATRTNMAKTNEPFHSPCSSTKNNARHKVGPITALQPLPCIAYFAFVLKILHNFRCYTCIVLGRGNTLHYFYRVQRYTNVKQPGERKGGPDGTSLLILGLLVLSPRVVQGRRQTREYWKLM